VQARTEQYSPLPRIRGVTWLLTRDHPVRAPCACVVLL
jgi:hypothetical protein